VTLLEVMLAVAALAGIAAGLLWLWIEHRGRTVFVVRGEWASIGEKVSEMDRCHASLKVLADGNEKRITLLEQADANQAERMSELVVKPLEGITRVLQAHGEILASHKSDMRSIGRSLDELRGDMKELKRGQSP